jgi:hypothetical protein
VRLDLPGCEIESLNFSFKCGQFTTSNPGCDSVRRQAEDGVKRSRRRCAIRDRSRRPGLPVQVRFHRSIVAKSLGQARPAASCPRAEQRPDPDLSAERPDQKPRAAGCHRNRVEAIKFFSEIAIGENDMEGTIVLNLNMVGAEKVAKRTWVRTKRPNRNWDPCQPLGRLQRVHMQSRPESGLGWWECVGVLAQVTPPLQLAEDVIHLGWRGRVLEVIA